MDETFRLGQPYLHLGLGLLLAFLAWTGLDLYLVLTDPQIRHPVAFAVAALGVPLAMAGLSAWLVAAYVRHELTIRGETVTFRGVVREITIGLPDVTRARWRPLPAVGGVVSLRTASARLAIELNIYAPEGRERIIRHLRSMVSPEVQVGWNLYAYKVQPFRPRPAFPKPGPDEVLLRRDRWDRYLGAGVASSVVGGFAAWWFTGERRFFAAPVMPLGLWACLRFLTPAEGMVARKLSKSIDPQLLLFLGFLPLWFGVAVAGLLAHEYSRPGPAYPRATLGVGIVAWLAVLLYEAIRLDRRTARREREAADLAAKARGEPPADPWPSE